MCAYVCVCVNVCLVSARGGGHTRKRGSQLTHQAADVVDHERVGGCERVVEPLSRLGTHHRDNGPDSGPARVHLHLHAYSYVFGSDERRHPAAAAAIFHHLDVMQLSELEGVA